MVGQRTDASVDRLPAAMLPFYRSWLSIRRLEVPTIAAINGAAIGAGLCMPLACDIRVASTRARMGVPFTRLGMHSGMGRTYLLPDVVGHSTARDLLLTGRLVDAQEALRIGLVSRVLPRRTSSARRSNWPRTSQPRHLSQQAHQGRPVEPVRQSRCGAPVGGSRAAGDARHRGPAGRCHCGPGRRPAHFAGR